MRIDRREFIKSAAVLGAGVVLAPSLVGESLAGPPGPLVVRAKGKDVAKLARKSVDALGGMKKFVRKGDTVVVKPNIGWDRQPEYAGNTHPLLVREVALMCVEAGAARVLVFDRTCNDPRRCYVNSGIQPALEELGEKKIEVSHIDERKFVERRLAGGFALGKWSFYRDVTEADRFINMPVAKHHSAATLTLGMKNIMGIIGGNRSVLHRRIHESLVDLNMMLKSDLTVLDATRILVANGPQGGDLKDVRKTETVIAGADIVAVDSTACSLFGLGYKDVGYIRMAHEKGLGVADPARINLKELAV